MADLTTADLAAPGDRTLLAPGHHAAVAGPANAILVDAMDRALEDHHRGVLVVHFDGRLVAATPTAERLLSTHLGVRLAAGQCLPHRLAILAGGSPATRPPLALEGQGAKLYARVLPRSGGDTRTIVIDERRSADVAPLAAAGLTRRELQILELIATGETNAEIAGHLNLSIRTVHKHLEHLYTKLDVHDRIAAATRWLAEQGDTSATTPE